MNTKEFISLVSHPKSGYRDVLFEFYQCLRLNPCDYVVRLTADCPMLSPELIDCVIYHGIENNADYCSNVITLTFPDGVDTELVSSKMLKWLYDSVKSPYHREHVTSIIRDSKDLQDEFNVISIENLTDLSRIKISVDTPEDLNRIKTIDSYG